MSFILGANYQYYLGFSALCTRISALLPGTFCSISYFFDNGFTLVEHLYRSYFYIHTELHALSSSTLNKKNGGTAA